MIDNQQTIKNKQKKHIDELTQIQKLCNQSVDIDINHRMTRTMISSLTNIIKQHIGNHETKLQTKQVKQQIIQQQVKSKHINREQNRLDEQIDAVKTIIENKTLALDNLITNLRIQMKNTLIEWGNNLDSQLNIHKLNINKTIQIQQKKNNDKINIINKQCNDKLKLLQDQLKSQQVKNTKNTIQLILNVNKMQQQSKQKFTQIIQLIKKLNEQFIKNSKQNKKIQQILNSKQQQIQNIMILKQQKIIKSINWIDANCACYESLNIKDNIITNNKAGEVQIFGKAFLGVNNASFSVCPIKIKSNFVIGIVDSNRKTQVGWPGHQIKRLLYQSNGNVYHSNQTKCFKTGHSFQCGETIKVQIDFVKGIIEWKIDGIVKQSMKCINLTKNTIKWAPFINMDNIGDSFMIVNYQ